MFLFRFRMLNYYASILFLMVMSIDRYLAINHAMNSIANKLRSIRAVRMVSAVLWAICFMAVTHVLWITHVLPCDVCAIKFSYDNVFQNASGTLSIFFVNNLFSQIIGAIWASQFLHSALYPSPI